MLLLLLQTGENCGFVIWCIIINNEIEKWLEAECNYLERNERFFFI